MTAHEGDRTNHEAIRDDSLRLSLALARSPLATPAPARSLKPPGIHPASTCGESRDSERCWTALVRF